MGLAVTDRIDDLAFRARQAILVTTFQKLVNGQSVFGVVGDSREKLDVGIVIVDDVHAALTTTEAQFRLTVPASHAAYEALNGLFAPGSALSQPRAGRTSDPRPHRLGTRAALVVDRPAATDHGHPSPPRRRGGQITAAENHILWRQQPRG